MRAWTVVFVAALLTASSSAQPARDKSLTIYVVDVEGGNATLFVGPSGGSVLIDTGNGGAAAARDADRIMAAVKDAGLTQIDHLITTHWHGDHFGAMAELAAADPDPPLRRSRAERAAGRRRRRVPAEGLPDALRRGEAHGREAGRLAGRPGPGLANRDLRGQRADLAAAGSRPRESLLRRLQAAGGRPHGERPVGRERRSRSDDSASRTSAI